jgi:hypothetical protein
MLSNIKLIFTRLKKDELNIIYSLIILPEEIKSDLFIVTFKL